MLTLPGAPGEYDAMVRHIGFARADRFFTLQAGDTVSRRVRDTLLHLTVSPRDTTPITLTLGAPH